MNNLKDVKPNKNQWVLYIAIAKTGGHQQAQLCKWNESFDEFFADSEDEYDTFWVEAKEPGIALLRAQIAAKSDESREYNALAIEADEEYGNLLEELEVLNSA